MNYGKNIVNITQNSFSLSPPIISLPLSWIIGVVMNLEQIYLYPKTLAQNTLDPQGKASNERTNIM